MFESDSNLKSPPPGPSLQTTEAKTASTAPSPWKKPKIVSFGRTRSVKRRSELLNLTSFDDVSDLSQTNPDVPEKFSSQTYINESSALSNDENQFGVNSKPAKVRKVVFNRFSVTNSLSFASGQEHVDLCDFFGKSNNDDSPDESKIVEPNQNLTVKDVNINYMMTMTMAEKDLGTSNAKVEKKFDFEHESEIPFDLSLKTRCRFVSSQQFTCTSAIKSVHESESILNYAKFNCFYQNLDKHKFQSAEKNREMFKTLFGEATSYWSFPYLPWLNLYPRNTNNGNRAAEPLSTDIQKSLCKCWNQSFKSLYNSLKSNHCPYFYVLTHSFVVLFKSETIGFNNEMTAVLTPSTKGLRKSLSDINFTMPLAPASQQALLKKSESVEFSEPKSKTSLNESANSNNESGVENASLCENPNLNLSNSSKKDEIKEDTDQLDDDGNEDEEDEDHEEWLEKVGLDSKMVTLQRNSKNANKDSLFYFDNRPRSTLLFAESSEVQALFNHLLNSKTCMLTSGPLAGVPPTLLAPIPFVGATLQKMRLEQNVIKSIGPDGESQTQYAIDIIGPLMPYHIHRLTGLFRVTQGANGFNMTGNAYEQSTGLNCAPRPDEFSGGEKPECSYLDRKEWDSFSDRFGVFGEAQAVRSIMFDSEKQKFFANYSV